LTQPAVRTFLIGAAILGVAAACQTGAGAPARHVPKLEVTGYEFQLRRHIGQTVRVCGRLTRERNEWAVEHIPGPDEFYFHGYPAVLIKACGTAPPRLDADGCIAGRVAASDGNVVRAVPRSGGEDDSPVDPDWFLHPQCPVRRG